ncbi:MAG: type II toxin-antitoxin system HicA family toxin [Dehalococcoidia bacterium]|nr:type II toxin-antitoxin system HicA family toxin [Dehalococcoidia bacterium]
MTYRDFTSKLRRLGCVRVRQGRGDHVIWANDRTRSSTAIPNWGSRDLKPGTMRSILRSLGISRDEFDRA